MQSDEVTISDLIGEFGYFQSMIVLIAFVRYVILATMTNSGALIAPDPNFQCLIPVDIVPLIEVPSNQSIDEYSKNRCEFKLTTTNLSTTTITSLSSLAISQQKLFKCNRFKYLDQVQTGPTLTNTFNLVCDRDSLRSTFQSIVTLGVISSVIWGSISDRFGRAITYKICFVWSTIFGIISYLAEDFLTFTLSRCLCTFGDLGLVISITAVVVETLGNKYRGTMCIIIYTGWSIGVMIMPWIIEYFKDFKQVMFFLVICHILTLPWMFWIVGESIRWNLVEGYFQKAKDELYRIHKWNKNNITIKPKSSSMNDPEINLEQQQHGIVSSETTKFSYLFERLKIKYSTIADKRKAERELEANWSRCKYYFMLPFGGLSKMGELFITRELTIVTLATAWITFNGEFFYMFTTQINSDIGDIKSNYAIGGLMEILATLISIVMISMLARKLSLFLTLFTMLLTNLKLAIFIHHPSLSVWSFNSLKFATSTLTSLVYVVITELYPTNLRQTGMGVTGLMGSSGAFIAPFVRTELANIYDLQTVLYGLTLLPATALITTILIRETRGVELTDDIDELSYQSKITTTQQLKPIEQMHDDKTSTDP